MLLPTRGYSLVLFDADVSATSKTKDTQDYLSRSVIHNNKNYFFVPWGYNGLTGAPPTDFTNCCLNGQPYQGAGIKKVTVEAYGESLSTILVQEASETNTQVPDCVIQGMFLLKPEYMTYLRGEFSRLFAAEWKIQADDNTKSTMLVVERDTGRQLEGVYPELDTGNGIAAVRGIVQEMMANPPPNHTLKVISCGYGPESSVTGIGQYWTKLPKVDQIPNVDPNQPVTKRDIEAYFLYWASQENPSTPYFQMVVGLRSGVMDLFTLMGIPTVSIGLRNMVGESRHQRLCGPAFKRLNIQYDWPRHSTTAYIQGRKKYQGPLLNSPFWLGPAPGRTARGNLSPQQMDQQKTSLLQPFGDFDTFVLKVGLRLACQTYLRWSVTVLTKNPSFPQVMTTSDARFCYLAEDTEPRVKDRLLKRQAIDSQAIRTMRAQLRNTRLTLQLSDIQFDRFYWNQYTMDWKQINQLPP
ncbi:hypothetical protein MGU_11081 [Metarhizium guizhouense ARSEF 977]|uniref:Uncharacterized protein n=1 Tax=Metarhizium guizhouense (strain ARSEF 977) TaxID=1276136 RepID=A0A0B4HQ61_METGA|nr:hypothetical protein MGU_11081 [Metarhizium guizhouense ARSEF 977]